VELYGQLLAILATFALLGAALWLLRRGGRISWPAAQKGSGRELVVVETKRLSPAHSLYLVEVRGRAVLIATHPGGASFHDAGESFGGALRQSLRATGVDGQ
jgi:flagellar biogenesis protein FliO